MVKVEGRGGERPAIKIVDTTTEKVSQPWVAHALFMSELVPQDIDVAEQLVEEGAAEWTAEVGHCAGNASPFPPSLLPSSSLLPPPSSLLPPLSSLLPPPIAAIR